MKSEYSKLQKIRSVENVFASWNIAKTVTLNVYIER